MRHLLKTNLKLTITNEKGFTLIESLFVLSIFLMILSISSQLNFKTHQDFKTSLFLKQFTSDIQYGQQYAISNGTLLFITIDSAGHAYTGSTPAGKVFTKGIPKHLDILPGTMGLKFHFVPSGNISKAGVLYIIHGKKTSRIHFMLGKGRFYINEG
nr:competence type IV pilus minor pilin ComGD [Peribacillus deserti]